MNVPRLAVAILACVLAVAPARAADAAPVTIRIIAVNDLHGHLEAGDHTVAVPDPADATRTVALPSGGAAHLATLIAELRREHPASIVVSSGDLIGAAPLVSGLFNDEPTIEVMNAIGLDVNAVGNHEFDRGVDELMRIVAGGCKANAAADRPSCAGPSAGYSGARFAFLAANVVGRTDDRPILPPALVKSYGGVQVGFIGVTTRATPGIVMPAGIAGVRFLTEARTLNHHAALLKAQGVHAIVALVHEGGEADGGINDCRNPRGPIFDIVRELDSSIDVVFSGHTHRAYRCVIRGGRIVIQGASFGRLVSVVDLQVDAQSGVLHDRTRARNLPVPNGRQTDPRLNAHFPPLARDPKVAAIVDHYRERAAPLADRPVGRIAAPFDRRPAGGGDHAFGRLIADSQLAATRAAGAQIAFTNPGGVRSELRGRPDGSVTYGDLYAAQPFGNSLVTVTLTGAQLRTMLEQQWSAARPERARMLQPSRGFTYAYDGRRSHGNRVVPESMRLEGRVIEPDRDYRITINSYLAAGGDGFRVLHEARQPVGGGLDVDALAEYFRWQGQRALAPDRNPRIARVR